MYKAQNHIKQLREKYGISLADVFKRDTDDLHVADKPVKKMKGDGVHGVKEARFAPTAVAAVTLNVGERGMLSKNRTIPGFAKLKGTSVEKTIENVARYEYLGTAGRHTKMHLFRSINGGYLVTVTDFELAHGEYIFKGDGRKHGKV